MLVLAEYYRARSGTGFGAYMHLQRALLRCWMARGGTEEGWCERMAPAFRHRYSLLIDASDEATPGQG